MIIRIESPKTTTPGWFNRALAPLLIAGLVFAPAPLQAAAQLAPPGRYAITHLRVVKLSADGTRATITADYTYDGFGKPLLQVSPMAESTALQGTASWFIGESVTAHPGRGRLTFQVEYLAAKANAPAQFTTDRITLGIARVGVKEPPRTLTFKTAITWGTGGFADSSIVESLESRANPAPTPTAPKPSSENKVAGVLDQNAGLEKVPPGAPTPAVAAIELAGSLSALPPATRPAWQERFTLGPGDVLNFSLFNEPDLALREVFIGPDGRVSYLEAHSVLASGLTVDELRATFDTELGKYRRSPRTIITPAAYHSKKYYLLGRVMQKGAFTLDRPITIIEAVARARGFETGLAGRNVVELADLSHSFLAREGKRVPVDFEQLFLAGNLQQNVALAPGDYLYFPSSNPGEVYVLGEVRTPGVHNFIPGTTAVSAITGSGGFTAGAWKKKVVIVRGSLSNPETFIVDVGAVLAAKSPDFKLQPRDIIYVSNRPWAKVEELLDIAVTAFIQGAVITWTGGNIGPLIK